MLGTAAARKLAHSSRGPSLTVLSPMDQHLAACGGTPQEAGNGITAPFNFGTDTMIEGWQDRIDEAQHEKTADVGGVDYPRLGHGALGSIGQSESSCTCCGVLLGQLHVSGCTIERCPRCMVDQRFGCRCFVLNPEVLRRH